MTNGQEKLLETPDMSSIFFLDQSVRLGKWPWPACLPGYRQRACGTDRGAERIRNRECLQGRFNRYWKARGEKGVKFPRRLKLRNKPILCCFGKPKVDIPAQFWHR